jgi:predicted TIM-barrel fold metal-dependent hydrolase
MFLPERWPNDFDALELKPAPRAKTRKANAAKVLGLD